MICPFFAAVVADLFVDFFGHVLNTWVGRVLASEVVSLVSHYGGTGWKVGTNKRDPSRWDVLLGCFGNNVSDQFLCFVNIRWWWKFAERFFSLVSKLLPVRFHEVDVGLPLRR